MKKLTLILLLVCCIGLTSCTNDHPRVIKSETEWMYIDDVCRVVKLDSIHYMMFVNYNMSGRPGRPIVFNTETGEIISLDYDIK